MATNAFLSWSLGLQYNVTLLGLSEMPKPGRPPCVCNVIERRTFLIAWCKHDTLVTLT